MSATSDGLTHTDLDKGLIEAKSAAAFTERAYKEFMSFRDAKYLLTITASTPDTVEEWLDRIHDLEDTARNTGKYIPTPDGELRALEFWDFQRARGRFVDHMSVDFNARINSISDIGRMAVFTVDKHLYSPFYDFNPQSLIFAFRKRREGILATVSGTMGAGKTDFTCRIVEELLASPKPEFNIITNIKMGQETLDRYEGRLAYRRDMRGLLRLLCETVLGDAVRHSVVPLDETSMFFSRREPGKKTNILLEKFIRLIRKYNASLIFIDQLKDGLPGAALELRTVIYHKTDLTMLHYSSIMGGRNYNHYLSYVPQTTLKYITKDVGSFSMNVPLQQLFDFIEKKEEEGLDAVRASLMFLDSHSDPGDLSKDQRILDYIEKNPGCSQKQVAVALGDLNEGNLSVTMTRLEREGVVDRERDGRGYSLYLQKSKSVTDPGLGNTTTEA